MESMANGLSRAARMRTGAWWYRFDSCSPTGGQPLTGEPCAQVVDSGSQLRVAGDLGRYATHGVENRAVVAITEASADLREALACELASEIHGDFTRARHGRATIAGEE